MSKTENKIENGNGSDASTCYLNSICWIDYGVEYEPFAASIRGRSFSSEEEGAVERYAYLSINSSIVGSAKPGNMRPLNNHSDHLKLRDAELKHRAWKARKLLADNPTL